MEAASRYCGSAKGDSGASGFFERPGRYPGVERRHELRSEALAVEGGELVLVARVGVDPLGEEGDVDLCLAVRPHSPAASTPTRAAIDALCGLACSPCQRADWYADHAVATAASASSRVAAISMRRSRVVRLVPSVTIASARPLHCTESGVAQVDGCPSPSMRRSERSIATGRMFPDSLSIGIVQGVDHQQRRRRAPWWRSRSASPVSGPSRRCPRRTACTAKTTAAVRKSTIQTEVGMMPAAPWMRSRRAASRSEVWSSHLS